MIQALLDRSHSNRYEDPAKMVHLASLASLAADACSPEAAGGDQQLADLRTQAWGQLGNALRVNGRMQEATDALKTASAHCSSGTGDLQVRALLLSQLSILHNFQREFDLAISLAEEAGRIYQSLGEPHLFARSLLHVSAAAVYSGDAERAIAILYEAIPLIDRERDPSMFLAAHHNLTLCYINLNQPEEAIAILHDARELYRECKDPLILVRATWQEGQLLRDVGHLHNAEAALVRARKSFMEYGLAYEVALVSLDLAEVYFQLGEMDSVRRTTAEAIPIFRSLRLGRETLAALLQLQQAAERGQAADPPVNPPEALQEE
jgi:tetratricopeptide (TPR) repeat protein